MVKIYVLLMTISILNLVSCHNPEIGQIYNYDSYQNTPVAKLANAVERHDTSAIRELVTHEKLNINYQDSIFGLPVLALAVLDSNVFCAEQLLKLGADPNLKSPKSEDQTPFLQFCKYSSDTLMLKLLIKYGANVNAISDETRKKYSPGYDIINMLNITPLEALCMNSSLSCVKILVNNGARLDIYPKNGHYSLITTATINKDIDILKYLLIEKKVPIPDYAAIRQKGTPNEVKIGLRQLLSERRYSLSREPNDINMLNEVLSFLKANGK